MGHLEMANAFTAALNAQQWDTVASYLTDDFIWTGGSAGTQNKQGFLAAQKAQFTAMPDYRVTWTSAREEGDAVHGTIGVAGTQTKPLALPGLPQIPATGKHIAASFPTKVTWRGDKIAAIGLGESSKPTVLEQLGIQLPG